MSGWIKFEKDLLTDPRVLRVAKTLSERFRLSESTGGSEIFETGNDRALPAVTLVCGALARLWVLADTHIDSDSVLPLGCDELDEILGLPGFCSTLPKDWLVVIDEGHVQLPDFHKHNGTEAKKKAVTQKRVSNWRSNKNHKALPPRNGRALPDQDQTKTIQEQVIFDHWKVVHEHPQAKLDAKRTKLIRKALKLYSPDDLKRCVDGYRRSPWHQGKNDRKQVYDDIELMLRDAKHIDEGIKLLDKPEATQWM